MTGMILVRPQAAAKLKLLLHKLAFASVGF